MSSQGERRDAGIEVRFEKGPRREGTEGHLESHTIGTAGAASRKGAPVLERDPVEDMK